MREAAGELAQKAHFFQRLLHLVLTIVLVFVQVVVDQAFGHYVVHLGALVQGCHGILEDHLQGADHLGIHLLGDAAADALALKQYLALGDGVDAHDGAADSGLAAAALAHQSERFALVYLEVHVVDRHELLAPAAEGDLQVLDLEQGLAVGIQMRMVGVGVRAHGLGKLA